MLKKKFLVMASCFTVLGLLLASCAPAAGPATPKPSVPTEPTAKPAPSPEAKPGVPTPSPKPAAKQPRYGGILKTAAYMDESTFDLHVSVRSLGAEQVAHSYSGLLQYDPEDGNRIITDLAEKYDVAQDGKKISFLLNKNVRWHDGKPLTSEDVKFNFERWMKPPEGVVIARKEIGTPVERVETSDPHSVEVYLKYPSASFIPMVAMGTAAMLPPQYLKDHKTMEFSVLGTGPYKLKRYMRGVSIEHVKNDDYFIRGRPYLDGVTQYMIPDRSARFAALAQAR